MPTFNSELQNILLSIIMVSYVPLIDEGSQAFVAATPPAATTAGNLAVPTTPQRGLAGQTRPAIILSTTEAGGVWYANLSVFTDVGDPFRGATPDAVVRVLRVPFSEGKEPGTFHRGEAIRLGPSEEEEKDEPFYTIDGIKLSDMTVDQLRANADLFSVDLGTATRKADLLHAIVADFDRKGRAYTITSR